MAQNCINHPDRESVSFCVKCGAPMCPECEKPFDGRPYCAACVKKRKEVEKKTDAEGGLSRLKGAAGGVGTALAAAKDGAGGQFLPKEAARILARTIDLAIVVLLSLLVHWPIRMVSKIWMPDVSGVGFIFSLYLALLLVGTAYFVVSEWRTGRTVGKWLLGLRVVRYGTKSRPALSESFWRWTGFLAAGMWAYAGYWITIRLLKWIGLLRGKIPAAVFALLSAAALAFVVVFSLGLLITFVGKYKRGYHDLLGGTIVERVPRAERKNKDESETG